MKPLQLPKNKFVRLFLNIIFIPIWYFLTEKILLPIIDFIFFLPNGRTAIYMNDFFRNIYFLSIILAFVIPIMFFTRYVWFGRLRPRPRVTRSKN